MLACTMMTCSIKHGLNQAMYFTISSDTAHFTPARLGPRLQQKCFKSDMLTATSASSRCNVCFSILAPWIHEIPADCAWLQDRALYNMKVAFSKMQQDLDPLHQGPPGFSAELAADTSVSVPQLACGLERSGKASDH